MLTRKFLILPSVSYNLFPTNSGNCYCQLIVEDSFFSNICLRFFSFSLCCHYRIFALGNEKYVWAAGCSLPRKVMTDMKICILDVRIVYFCYILFLDVCIYHCGEREMLN